MPGSETKQGANAIPINVAEFCQVHVEIARLRERFYMLQTALAAPCPVCKGLGSVRQGVACRTCGAQGRILPLFSVENRLIYQDSLGNLVELDAEGNDSKWPDKLQICAE